MNNDPRAGRSTTSKRTSTNDRDHNSLGITYRPYLPDAGQLAPYVNEEPGDCTDDEKTENNGPSTYRL